MRRRLALVVLSLSAAVGMGFGLSAPADAAAKPPVRVGTDSCGNFQIWVNDSPIISWLICHGG